MTNLVGVSHLQSISPGDDMIRNLRISLHTHLMVQKSLITKLDKLKEKLTIVASTANGDDRIITQYVERGDFVGIPLYHPIAKRLQSNAVTTVDRRIYSTPQGIQMKSMPRNEQIAVWRKYGQALTDGKQGILLKARTGFGKCHAAGTPVLMYDGTTKKVEDIEVGDLLMGPDSKSRIVLSLARGRDEMFDVIPTKGEKYTVNKDHVLSLKKTGDTAISSGVAKREVYTKGEIVDIPIWKYRLMSKKFKHLHKGWRIGVDFPVKDSLPRELPPYLLGIWLGDGSSRSPHITTTDEEVVVFLREYARSVGLFCLPKDDDPITWTIGSVEKTGSANSFRAALFQFDLVENKHIPHLYKTASREDRLRLLAGLLDADGYLDQSLCGYEIVQKREVLADDICFLARSLGLAAYKKKVKKTCTNNGKEGVYFRVIISGNCQEIPCRVLRKKAQPRRQKKDVLVTGIKIQSVGVGDYYGFELSGDGRYLLGDFTVTHNTVCLLKAISLIDRPTLVIVPREFIMEQWANRIVQHTNVSMDEIGKAQQGICQFQGKKIVIGIIHSLCKDRYPERFRRYFGCVVWDEVHTVGATTFSETTKLFPSAYRLGASATMDRKDGMSCLYYDSIGEHVISVGAAHVDRPRVFRIQYSGSRVLAPPYLSRIHNKINRRGVIISAIASDQSRNGVLARAITRLVRKGRRVLVLSERVKQLNTIAALIARTGIDMSKVGTFIGSTPQAARQRIIDKSQVILATYQVFAMAVDLPPDFSSLVLATPVADGEQAVGRIMREMKGKAKPIVFDMVDIDYKDSLGWSMARYRLWDAMDSEVFLVTPTDFSVIEQLRSNDG